MTVTSILSGSSVSSGGSQVVPVFEREMTLYFNSQGTSFSGGTIQFRMEEVDPGDQASVISNTWVVTGIFSAGPLLGHISLPAVSSGYVLVSWIVAGTPTISPLFLTLVEKEADVDIPSGLGGNTPAIGNTNQGAPGGTMVVGGVDHNGVLRSALASPGPNVLGGLVVCGLDVSGTTYNAPLIDGVTRTLGVGGATPDGAIRAANPVLIGGTSLHGNGVGNVVSTLATDDHNRLYVTPGASTYIHLSTQASGTLVAGLTTLHKVVINTAVPSSSQASLTIYDNNVSPAAPVFATFNLAHTPVGDITYDVAMKFGLSYFISGANVGDVTIVYG